MAAGPSKALSAESSISESKVDEIDEFRDPTPEETRECIAMLGFDPYEEVRRIAAEKEREDDGDDSEDEEEENADDEDGSQSEEAVNDGGSDGGK